ncbi:MAG: creatininase family protein [Candidatus Moranbacteria bacterium]|nr:creatininase family protein [Candidatus Moranbacteria bacterium]
MTTYLKDFEKMAKRGIAYIPLGVLEWHGNHLPIETDFLVAVKLCEELSKKKPGYILPPIYLGTDKQRIVKGQKLIGMDRHLGKKLPGNTYFLEPALFEKMIIGLGKTLNAQGFRKVYLVAGHTGTGQINALKRAVKKMPGMALVDPYDKLKTEVKHADEFETSILWACHPEEEKISRRRKIPATDDCFRFYGRDLRKKASVALGRKILKEMIGNCLKIIKK